MSSLAVHQHDSVIATATALQLGPEGVGNLTSFDGIGAFAEVRPGAVVTPGWHARGYVGWRRRLIWPAVIVFALTPSAVSAGAALLLTGLAGAAFSTLQATIVYLAAPVEMRSRVLGVLSVCIGTGPIGFLWLGWLANQIGAAEALQVTAALGLLALAATAPLWRRI
jgi:hypothetical protein